MECTISHLSVIINKFNDAYFKINGGLANIERINCTHKLIILSVFLKNDTLMVCQHQYSRVLYTRGGGGGGGAY